MPANHSCHCEDKNFLLGISNMSTELLEMKILKKQNKLKNKVIFYYYEKFLKLK